MRDPVIWRVRKDLRLSDNPALAAALEAGGPVIPVFVPDEVFETYGAAALWRSGPGVEEFARSLNVAGSRLVCRHGPATAALLDVASEIGARTIRWCRAYDAPQVARDRTVRAALQKAGTDGRALREASCSNQARSGPGLAGTLRSSRRFAGGRKHRF